jgi:hypothetical protein
MYGMGNACSMQRLEICTEFWLKSLKEREHSEDVGVSMGIILRWILGKCGVRVWHSSMWLRIRIGGRLT